MGKFRKKPVVIDAMQFNGSNRWALMQWATDMAGEVQWDFNNGRFYVVTLEGRMEVSPDDWVIRGVKGEYYPCKPDIFAATYEPAQPSKGEK